MGNGNFDQKFGRVELELCPLLATKNLPLSLMDTLQSRYYFSLIVNVTTDRCTIMKCVYTDIIIHTFLKFNIFGHLKEVHQIYQCLQYFEMSFTGYFCKVFTVFITYLSFQNESTYPFQKATLKY